MKMSIRSLIYNSLLLVPLLAQADTEIAGIQLQDHFTRQQHRLVLNGAGIRSKFFVKVYVGALYLPQKSTSSSAILAMKGPRSMQMHILYKEITAAKIADGWTEGFRANLSEQDFTRLATRLDQFNHSFPILHSGDAVYMDYLPEQGTRLSINGRETTMIEGEDFFTALLKVWIGEHPADDKLKKGLLGP